MPDMNEIKALPLHLKIILEPPPEPKPQQQFVEDLVNLRDDAVSSDDQGHSRLALALFAGSAANGTNESREAFPSSNRQPEVTHGTADACC